MKLETEFSPAMQSRSKAKNYGLNRLQALRRVLVSVKRLIYVRGFGMDIHPTAEFSLSARLDRTFPKGVHIGAYSYVAFDAVILTHDRTRGLYLHTRVDRNCFIGARSLVLPGLTIGAGSIVAAGAVVTKSVPPKCIVAGNPARIMAEDIQTDQFGRFLQADDTESALVAAGQV